MAVRTSTIIYKIEDQATGPLKQIEAATKRAGEAAGGAQPHVQRMQEGFLGAAAGADVLKGALMGLGAGVVLGGIAAITAALVGIGRSTILAGGEVQRFTATLNALHVSADRITSLQERLAELGQAGVLSTDALERGAQRLAAFGVQVERIPAVLQGVMDTQAKFGDTSEETAQEIITSYGRITESYGDAMRALMALQKVGISSQQLQAHGVLFDIQGQMLNTVANRRRLQGAITDIFAENKGQSAALGNTPQAAMVRLGNALRDVQRILGGEMAPTMTRFLDTLTRLVQRTQQWLQNGGLVQIKTVLAGLMPILRVVGFLMLTFAQAIWSAASFVAQLVKWLNELWQMLKRLWDIIAPIVQALKAFIANLPPPIRLLLEDTGIGAALLVILGTLTGIAALKLITITITVVGDMALAALAAVGAAAAAIPTTIAITVTVIAVAAALVEVANAVKELHDRNVTVTVSAVIDQTLRDTMGAINGLSDKSVLVTVSVAVALAAIASVVAALAGIPVLTVVTVTVVVAAALAAIASVVDALVKVPSITAAINVTAAGVEGVINSVINALNAIPLTITTVLKTVRGEGEGSRSGGAGIGNVSVGSGTSNSSSSTTSGATAGDDQSDRHPAGIATTGGIKDFQVKSGTMQDITNQFIAAGMVSAGVGAAVLAGSLGGDTSGGGGSLGFGGGRAPSMENRQGGCFVAGTPVQTPGGEVPIEMLAVGDTVLCWDFSLARLVETMICEMFVHEDCAVLRLTLADGRALTVTPEHLLRVDGCWEAAGNVRPGQCLADVCSGKAGPVTVAAVDVLPEHKRVFNLHVVHSDHNFVAAGILVHNKKAEDDQDSVAMAAGGIVMPRPGGTSALIGEGGQPEMVLPLSRARDMGFGNGGGGVTVHINLNGGVYADQGAIRDLADKIASVFTDRLRLQTGMALRH